MHQYLVKALSQGRTLKAREGSICRESAILENMELFKTICCVSENVDPILIPLRTGNKK